MLESSFFTDGVIFLFFFLLFDKKEPKQCQFKEHPCQQWVTPIQFIHFPLLVLPMLTILFLFPLMVVCASGVWRILLTLQVCILYLLNNAFLIYFFIFYLLFVFFCSFFFFFIIIYRICSFIIVKNASILLILLFCRNPWVEQQTEQTSDSPSSRYVIIISRWGSQQFPCWVRGGCHLPGVPSRHHQWHNREVLSLYYYYQWSNN